MDRSRSPHWQVALFAYGLAYVLLLLATGSGALLWLVVGILGQRLLRARFRASHLLALVAGWVAGWLLVEVKVAADVHACGASCSRPGFPGDDALWAAISLAALGLAALIGVLIGPGITSISRESDA